MLCGEVLPQDQFSGKKFWVQIPTELDGGCILREKPSIMTEDVIEVPIEFLY